MPYELSATGNRAYAFTYFNKPDRSEYDILAVSGGTRYLLGINGPLAKDFETCPTIVNKAKNKHYTLEENSLSELVSDYEGCAK
jgi:hypothetical protein